MTATEIPPNDTNFIQLREAVLSFATSNAERVELLAGLARASAPEEFARTLAALALDLPADVLGYSILPAVSDWLAREDGQVAALSLAEGRDTPATLRLALLDFLDAIARRKERADALWPTFRIIAADREAPAEVRAKATRLLHRDDSPATADLLGDLAGDRVVLVADEAYLAAARAGRSVSRDRQRALSTAVLRAFVESGDAAAVRRAADAVSTNDERLRILGAAGTLLESAQLAEIVSATATRPDVAGVAAVRGFFGPRPDQLARLYDEGHVDSFVDAVILLAGGFDTTTRERLIEVAGGDDRPRAGEALSLLDPDVLPDHLRQIRANGQVFTPEGASHFLDQNRLSPLNPEDASRPKGSPFTGDGWPFSTGFHLGDALYRDTIVPGPHWHTGIYEGFVPGQPTGSDGTLWLINADGLGFSEAIAPISAHRTLGSASTDVTIQMAKLRLDFIEAFQEGFDRTFHGSRSAPGITAAQRANIANTAAALQDHNIWWTWVDQLDCKWFGWDGTIDDIDETRCDGVVEYSYEANGVRVCGGTDPSLFDISAPDRANLENHNNFHNGAYTSGELCPRIQAGDKGDAAHAPANDTTFIQTTATPPALADVDAFGKIVILAPSIWFRVVAPAYQYVYVRVTVSLGSGPPHFIVTEDPYGNTSTLLGEWRFHTVPANTTSRLYAFWLGKTSDGTDFAGQDGTYTFRFLAIDRGGNVSALTSRTVSIDW
jgi:hypothetical protein